MAEKKKVVKEDKKKAIKKPKESPKKEKPKVEKTEKVVDKKKQTGIIFATGKRKKAVARASIKPGKGKVLINKELLENIKNRTLRLRIMEPLIISEKEWKSYDITVSIKGGGILGQTDAARQAIAKGLVELFGGDLRQKFLDYDRNLIAYDPRRTEPHKPPRSSQGPRRYKQRSKR